MTKDDVHAALALAEGQGGLVRLLADMLREYQDKPIPVRPPGVQIVFSHVGRKKKRRAQR